jgi:hypothetical protein
MWLVMLGALLWAEPSVGDEPHDDLKDACAASYEQGQTLRRAGNLSWAQAQLDICKRTCPEELAKDCARWSAELDREIPSVLVTAVDQRGKPVDGVSLSIDGTDVAMPRNSRPLKLAAGAHRLVLVKDGERIERSIELRPREQNVRIEIVFQRSQVTPPVSRRAARSFSPPVSVWILGGIGVAGLATGAILGVKGQLDRSDLRSRCAPDCDQTEVDSIKREWVIGGIAAGVGAAALGVAVGIALTSESDPSQGMAAQIGGRF